MRLSEVRAIVSSILLAWIVLHGSVPASESPIRPATTTATVTSPTTVGAAPTSPVLARALAAEKWLRTLEKRHSDHRRASGEITQVRKDPVFLEERRSTGKFYYERPNRFRCDYDQDKPDEAATTLVDGEVVMLYFPGLKQLERHRLSRASGGIDEINQMLLGFGIETDKILKHFTVASDPETTGNVVRMTFVPKAPRQDRPFAQFILDLTTKPDLTPKQFEIVGDEGDRTVVTISKITWNPTLPPDIFRLNPPKDVEIITEE